MDESKPELFDFEIVGLSQGNKHLKIYSDIEYQFGLYEATFSLPMVGTYDGVIRLTQRGGLRATYFQTVDFQAPMNLEQSHSNKEGDSYT